MIMESEVQKGVAPQHHVEFGIHFADNLEYNLMSWILMPEPFSWQGQFNTSTPMLNQKNLSKSHFLRNGRSRAGEVSTLAVTSNSFFTHVFVE